MKKLFPVLAVLAVFVVATSAGAVNIDSGMGEATTTVCKTINGIQKSAFLTMIALVMFIAGGVMTWLKMRGGVALMVTAFLGYFLVKQSMAIAQAFGLLPKGCATK